VIRHRYVRNWCNLGCCHQKHALNSSLVCS